MSKADHSNIGRSCSGLDPNNPIDLPSQDFAVCRIVVKVPVSAVETFITNWDDVSSELEYSVGSLNPEIISAVLTVPPGTKTAIPALQVIEGRPEL